MSAAGKHFSGWRVLAGCMILMIFPGGLLSYTSGLFLYPICEEFGFATSVFSLTLTVSAAVNALTSAFLVQYLSKNSAKSMKILMLISAFITCGGFACMGLCGKLWQFFVMAAVWNLGYNMLTYVPVGMMVSNWFVEKRAMMTGIAFAGGNLGGAIFNAVMSNIIAGAGWRTAYRFGGSLCLIFTLIAIALVRRSPAEYGEKAYGSERVVSAPGEENEATARWEGIDKKEAMKTPALRLLVVIFFITGIYSAGIANYVVTYLCGGGWKITAAGLVMTVYTLFGIIGNSAGGAVLSKIGLRKGMWIAVVTILLSLVCLALSVAIHPLAFVFAALLGIACVLSVLIPSQSVAAIFGTKGFAGIYGYTYAFYLIGCAVSTPFIAFLSEKAGFIAAWAIIGVLLVIIGLFYSKCFAYGKKLREENQTL